MLSPKLNMASRRCRHLFYEAARCGVMLLGDVVETPVLTGAEK